LSHSQLLASTASSTGVYIWNLATGFFLDLGLTNTTAFDFSSDGQLLATSSLRDGLTVWDVACLDPGHNQPLLDVNTVDNMALAFSPNGKVFVSRAEQGDIQIRDSQTGKPVRGLAEGSYPKSFQFSPDSKRLACYYWSSEHWIWDLVGGTKQLMSDKSKLNKMSCPVAYSANSQLASVCWNDNTLKLYDTTSGGYSFSLQGHVGMIYSITFSPQDNILASSSEYGTIQLWDTKTRTCQYVIQHVRGIYQGTLKFSPDGKILAYHNWELIHWWDVVTGSHQHMLESRLETGHGKFQEHSFSPNSLLLGVSVLVRRQIDEEVRLYDVKTAKHQSTLVGHSRRALEIIFSPDSSKVAVASSDRRVRLWDTTTCTLLYIFDIYTDVPKMTRFSHDGSIIAVASRDKAIRLWNVTTGEFLQMIYHDEGFIQELEVLAHEVIVSGTDKEPDKLWDPWRTETFKLSNQAYPLSAASHGCIPNQFYSEISLDLDECWVMRGYEKVIYIPVEYRPVNHKTRHRIGKWIKRGPVLCILCSTSKVIYLRLS
jgi:WD40 repeat protein